MMIARAIGRVWHRSTRRWRELTSSSSPSPHSHPLARPGCLPLCITQRLCSSRLCSLSRRCRLRRRCLSTTAVSRHATVRPLSPPLSSTSPPLCDGDTTRSQRDPVVTRVELFRLPLLTELDSENHDRPPRQPDPAAFQRFRESVNERLEPVGLEIRDTNLQEYRTRQIDGKTVHENVKWVALVSPQSSHEQERARRREEVELTTSTV